MTPSVCGPRWPQSRVAELLGVTYPIIQAPMAGGLTTPALVAAVSNAGGLGSLAAALLSPERIAAEIAAVRKLTERPFNVNLFVLESPAMEAEALRGALARLQPLREELGLPPGEVPPRFCESFPEQLEAVLEARPPVVSFTFGIVDRAVVQRLHRAGIRVVGTATHVAEALAWEAAGADAVCAQGAEAGGHRGTFLGAFEPAQVGTVALVPQVADAVRLPVIAAGGLMDGRGIAAVLMLGAGGAQLGTAFLGCPEAGTSAEWRERLQRSTDTSTRVTRVFSGRPARGLVNQFMERLRDAEQAVPDYPVQNALTAEIRAAARQRGDPEYQSLWAGQGAPLVRSLSAAELVAQLAAETSGRLSR